MNKYSMQIHMDKPAGFFLRLKASVLDTIIFWIAVAVIVLPIAALWGTNPLSIMVTLVGLKEHELYDPVYLLINMLASIPLMWMWSRFQASPGKLLTGVRIVDHKTGEKPNKKQVVIRAFGYLLSSLPLFAGFIWIALDKDKRGWHDYLAGTRVIKLH